MQDVYSLSERVYQSGDALLISALKRGINGQNYRTRDPAIMDAYIVGLDLYFKDWNLSELINAEQVVKGTRCFQKGFFDKLRQGLTTPILKT